MTFAFGQRCNNATKGADFLFRSRHSGKHSSEILHYGRAFMGGIEEAETVELGLEMLEKSNEFSLRRWPIASKIETRLLRSFIICYPAEARHSAFAHPGVAENQHRLRQVEGGEA